MIIRSREAVQWLAISIVTFLPGAAVLAQDGDSLWDEIVVVGTRGESRRALDSPVPVDVITADDIVKVSTLGGELGELLQALSPSFNFPRQSNSGSVDHIRPAQLRGMGPDQVLVLVNGKRQHTAAVVNLEAAIGLGSNSFDFNTIPLISIKRIEILRDGAAAQYGSDAIAGVINIVLKDAAEGGSVTATYGAHRTDFKPTGDTITDGDTFAVAADYGFAVGESGSFRFGVEYRDRTTTNRGGIGVLPFFEASTPANLALDPAKLLAPGDGDATDITVFFNTSFEAGNNEFYSFGHYNDRDAEGAAFFRYPDGDEAGVPSVYPTGYRPVTTGDGKDLSLSVGLRGNAFDSDWDLSLTVGQNDYDFGVFNSINPSLGAASPTSFHLAGFEFMQTTVNADVVRQINVASISGPLTLAYGAELRFEDYETKAGDPESFEEGPFAATANIGAEAGPGLDVDSVVDVDRFIYGIYVDLEARVTDKLLLGAAARYEDYDDFGDSLNGKLSGIYHFTENFAVRAAFGTSFRAPSLAQTGFAFSTQNFGAGGQLTLIGHLPVSDSVAIANGAVPLKEEESENLSVGFIVDMGEAFSLTFDYFSIDVDDRISIVSGSIDSVTFFTNLVNTETDGFDITASGAFDLGTGALDWSLGYNNSETNVKNPEVLGETELNALETMAPEDKLILSGNWNVDRWSVLLRATRFGETTRDFDFGGGFPDPQVYGENWSIDVEVGLDVTDSWTVAIGADNILDEYPDLSSDDNNFFGHLPYDVLPPIGMNGAYFYLRTQYDF